MNVFLNLAFVISNSPFLKICEKQQEVIQGH
jgi:hypothetical protein